MDLKLYFTPILKWWRLILVAALIAGISTIVALSGQPPIYEARATLMIGQSITSPNPSTAQFYLEQELAKIYADMGTREPIRRATRDALGIPSLPLYIVRALPNSQFIEISVRDSDPIRAKMVAEEVANQLIRQTPTDVNAEGLERERFIQEQIEALEVDIEESQAELTSLELQFGDLTSAREIADVERQIGTVDDKLRTLQSTYASLISSTQQGAVNTLTIIESPEIPRRSAGSNRLMSALLAMTLGASIATGGAYLIEYLDRRVHRSQEAVRVLGWPLLAEIEQMPREGDLSRHVTDEPHSSVSNEFRSLRTNLELKGMGHDIRSVLVTGPAVSEGKSTIARNLALIVATGEKRVVLIDADLHGPNLRFPEKNGLSELLLEGGYPTDYLFSPEDQPIFILPSGKSQERAAGLMDSANLARIFEGLQDVADIIIVDGPPAFVSDAVSLAACVDGVIAVVRVGHTYFDAINKMKEKFNSKSIHPLGVVSNGVTSRPPYYRGYYVKPEVETPLSSWRKQWGSFRGRLKMSRFLKRRSSRDEGEASEALT